jgi:hypothetical protein
MADPVTSATGSSSAGGKKKLKTSTVLIIAGVAVVGGILLFSLLRRNQGSGTGSSNGTGQTPYGPYGPGPGAFTVQVKDWQGHKPRPVLRRA